MSTPVWRRFGIPEAAAPYTDVFLTAEDQALISALEQPTFTAEDVSAIIGAAAEEPAPLRLRG